MQLCGSGLCKDIEENLSFIETSSDIHCTQLGNACHFSVESVNILTERNRFPYFKVQWTLAPAHFYYVPRVDGPTWVLSRCKEFKINIRITWDMTPS